MSTAEISLWHRISRTRLRDAIRGRFDASLDWRRVIAEAELPAELAGIVAAAVRSTRLWRSEKIDVARELIAHFQDGLDAGRTPDQLIDSFGDLLQTARLIRRAKQRGRSLAWHMWHYGWLTFAALLAAYVLTGLYMLTGRPAVNTDYLAIINERALAVPEAERAWPLYREALLALGPKATSGEYYPASEIPHSDAVPGDAAWPLIEQLLRDRAEAVAKLRAAAGHHGLGFVPANSFAAFTPEDRQLFSVTLSDADRERFKSATIEDRWIISTLLPNLQQLRSAASVLAADARRAVIDGDGKTALANVEALFGVSRHAQETPFLVNLLVASAAQQIALAAVREVATAQPALWSESQLRDLAHLVAASRVDWRRGYEGERAGFYDTMQRFYTDDGDGDGRLAFRVSRNRNVFGMLDEAIGPTPHPDSMWSHDSLAMLALPAANLTIASRKEMTDAYESFINFAMLKIDTPLWKQQSLPPPDEGLLSEQAGLLNKYRYLFVRLLVPAYDTLRNRIATSDGQRDGVLVGIALEMYHRQNGSWPASLDELAPRWLPAVPVDRITGEPLGYKLVDDRPVVYSIGVDRDDDGGRVPLNDSDQPDGDLASPAHFQLQPVTDAIHDGDWVIWSTVNHE